MTKIKLMPAVVMSSCLVMCSSCTLLHPLSLDPVDNKTAPEKIRQVRLSDFDGDYEIRSADSTFSTLEYTLANKPIFDYKKQPGKNDHITLTAVNNHHTKAVLFVNNKKVKSKNIKGRIKNDHFEFHNSHVSWKYVFFIYKQQTTRISLSPQRDLFVDTNQGGIGFLLILPVPLSGSSMDSYNTRFKQRKVRGDTNYGGM